MKRLIRALPLFLSLIGAMMSNSAFGEDRTILLDESVIQGAHLGTGGFPGRKKRVAGPALSTVLRWDGDQTTELDIPKEILDHLTQSDLSFFRKREFDLDDLDDAHFLEDDD